MSEWQPIETAPKVSSFLGFQDGYGINISYWCASHNGGAGGFRIRSSHGWSPTHWMPLPKPPEPNNET